MILQLRFAARPALLLALAAACHSNDQQRKPPKTPVRVARATRIDAPITVQASGVVEPMQTVAVTAQISGALLEVAFHEGDFVQRGQVLFRIDPRPLQAAVQQARATLARDEAQAEASRKDDARYQTLATKGYVSRSQADQIHATAQAQAATVEADRAALRSAEVSLGYATIRAPIAGRTGSLLVRQGNVVSPGNTPLVVINQIKPVLVRFPVLQQDFGAMQRAVAVRPLVVTATSNDSSEIGERGQLSFLDNAVDSLTGTVTGKATFPNFASRMWPGELVFLTIELAVERNVLAVPTPAVQIGQQGSYVYVVKADSSAQTRPVKSGLTVGDLTVIDAGLKDGELVVIDGQSRLNAGSRVAIVRDSGGRMNGRGDTSAAGFTPVVGEATPRAGSAGGDVVSPGGRAGRGGGGAPGANGGLASPTTRLPAPAPSMPVQAPQPTTPGQSGSPPTVTPARPSTPAPPPARPPAIRPL